MTRSAQQSKSKCEPEHDQVRVRDLVNFVSGAAGVLCCSIYNIHRRLASFYPLQNIGFKTHILRLSTTTKGIA